MLDVSQDILGDGFNYIKVSYDNMLEGVDLLQYDLITAANSIHVWWNRSWINRVASVQTVPSTRVHFSTAEAKSHYGKEYTLDGIRIKPYMNLSELVLGRSPVVSDEVVRVFPTVRDPLFLEKCTPTGGEISFKYIEIDQDSIEGFASLFDIPTNPQAGTLAVYYLDWE